MGGDLRARLRKAADHGDTPDLPVVALPAGLGQQRWTDDR
jgi:hypothetical protein